MNMQGIPYFPYIAQFTDGSIIDNLLNRYGAKGLGVYTLILQYIYSGRGYYLTVSEDTLYLICSRAKTDTNLTRSIIDLCLSKEIFDRTMFDKYKILTSNDIQENYINAIKRRKNIVECLEQKYLLSFADNFLKNVNKNTENVNKNTNYVDKSEQSKEKVLIENIIFPNECIKNIYYRLATEFPEKTLTDSVIDNICDNFDVEKLIKATKRSSKLLMTKDWANINWLIKHYKKIVNGEYDDFDNKVNTKDHKTFKSSSYQGDLNSLFDNLDEVAKRLTDN